MYSDEKIKKEEPVELEIHPLSKWKRILLFLSDYFLSFILAFGLLNVAIAPLFSLITNADKRGEEMRECQKAADSVFYGNKILLYKDDVSTNTDYNINFKHTYYRFLSYYVLDENINLYGPKIKNEVIYHYYNDIRSDKTTLVDLYNKQNQGHNLFVYDESLTTSFRLKEEVKNELHLFFVYPDEPLSTLGDQYMENLTTFFTVIYKTIIEDITKKDLTYNNISYLQKKSEYESLVNYDHWMMTTCILVSYVLSYGVIYLLIPLLNSTGKTIGMRIIKAERVDRNKLSTLRKPDVALTSSYFLFLNLSFIFFLPLTFTSSGFIYVLSLPLIPLLSLLSLILIIVSFIVLMFNGFNRSLTDVLSRSVIVVQDDLDAIYRYKGYYK